jgi:predicted nucleic acid-binding protein
VISLLDVNVLVALLVPEHEDHGRAQEWFASEAVVNGSVSGSPRVVGGLTERQ